MGGSSRRSPGLRSAASNDRIRLTLLVFCGYSFAVGILDVVLIVIARDVLHQSDGGAGALYSAFGVGGLLAGRRHRAARARAPRPCLRDRGGAVGGAHRGMAFVAQAGNRLGVRILRRNGGHGGAGAGDTVLQRATPDRLMSRVLGAYEALTGIAYMVAALVPAILIVVARSPHRSGARGRRGAARRDLPVGAGFSSSTVTST